MRLPRFGCFWYCLSRALGSGGGVQLGFTAQGLGSGFRFRLSVRVLIKLKMYKVFRYPCFLNSMASNVWIKVHTVPASCYGSEFHL